MTAAALGIVCVAIWLYVLLGRGRFWHVSIRRDQPAPLRRVVAIVPARNEADVIARTVSSLLKQDGVDLRIVVVDDNSTDATADVVRQLAIGSEDRLTVLPGHPFPAGWSGKLWAVQQGIDYARQFAPDYLFLTDADIEHLPANVASLISIAESGPFDLASFMVKLECQSLAERLLIPPFVYFFLQLYPPRWVSDPSAKTAGAAGGCILIRPDALQRAGAMQSIRNEIIDDCALARAVKRSGGRVWLGLTDSARSVRPYQSLAGIERMIARSAFNQLGHSALLLLVAILGLLLTYIVPVALLFGPMPWLGLAACLLMFISYYPMVHFYLLNPLWTLTLPLAAIFYMAATLDSAIRYWTGRGGHWKGRAQDVKSSESGT